MGGSSLRNPDRAEEKEKKRKLVGSLGAPVWLVKSMRKHQITDNGGRTLPNQFLERKIVENVKSASLELEFELSNRLK
jgi:hypothetical protein